MLRSHIPDTVPSCTTPTPGTRWRPDTAQPRPQALPARAPATAEPGETKSAFTSNHEGDQPELSSGGKQHLRD